MGIKNKSQVGDELDVLAAGMADALEYGKGLVKYLGSQGVDAKMESEGGQEEDVLIALPGKLRLQIGTSYFQFYSLRGRGGLEFLRSMSFTKFPEYRKTLSFIRRSPAGLL